MQALSPDLQIGNKHVDGSGTTSTLLSRFRSGKVFSECWACSVVGFRISKNGKCSDYIHKNGDGISYVLDRYGMI